MSVLWGILRGIQAAFTRRYSARRRVGIEARKYSAGRRCVNQLKSFTVDGRGSFLTDFKIRNAVTFGLHIMAESTQRLSDQVEFFKSHFEWMKVMRATVGY